MKRKMNIHMPQESKAITPILSITAQLAEYATFLTHIRQGDATSLTEMADFLRSGLLQAWCKLTPSQRHRLLLQLDRKSSKVPKRQSYAISRQMGVVCEWKGSKNDLLCGAIVLEALRHLLRTHSEVGAVQFFNARMKMGQQFTFGPVPFRTVLHLSSQTSSLIFPQRSSLNP